MLYFRRIIAVALTGFFVGALLLFDFATPALADPGSLPTPAITADADTDRKSVVEPEGDTVEEGWTEDERGVVFVTVFLGFGFLFGALCALYEKKPGWFFSFLVVAAILAIPFVRFVCTT